MTIIRKLNVLAVAVVLALVARGLRAQSTAFGKVLYAPDRWWAALQAHNAWMQHLDNTEEKSAASSGLVVEAAGYGLSKLTPMSFRRGRQAVAAMYALRAVYGLASGETNRSRAHVKHLAAVSAAAFLHVEVRF